MNKEHNNQSKTKRFLKKGARILLWIVTSVVVVFLLIAGLLQIPYFQNIVKDEVVTYLEKKIGTEVKIGYVEIGLPKKILLKDVYFASQQHDTLLAGKLISVDISLTKLLNSDLEINNITLSGITTNISRNRKGKFNFDYILKAFSSNKPKDPNATPTTIAVKNVILNNIKVKYNDDVTANYVNAKISHFETQFKKFDLDKLSFDVPEIKLNGLVLQFKQGISKSIKPTETSKATIVSPTIKLKLNAIELSKINLKYSNKENQLAAGLQLNKLFTHINHIDLAKQRIEIQDLFVNNFSGSLQTADIQNTTKSTIENNHNNNQNWKIKIHKTGLSDIAFKYDDKSTKKTLKGIDYKHIKLYNLNLKSNNLYYTDNSISGVINMFTIKEKSGLNITQLSTSFNYTNKGISLKNLLLKTPDTFIKDKIQITYPSLNSLTTEIGKVAINANMKNSYIAVKDVLLFSPDLLDKIKVQKKSVLHINGSITGTLNNLKVDNFLFYGVGNTEIAASGIIKGLPDVKRTYFDINLKKLKSTSTDLYTFIPASVIPTSINIPEHIELKGHFKGTVRNLHTNMNLSSSYGDVIVNGTLNQNKKGSEYYNANLSLTSFQLGKLLKNDSIGKVSFIAKVTGKGLKPQSATASLKGKLVKAEFKGYTYKNLTVNGTIKKGFFNAEATMKDPNINFGVNAAGGFKGKFPYGKIRLNIDIIDLEKLRLHAGPLKLRGNIDADITDSNFDNLNGKIAIHHFIFANEKEKFAMDSIKISALTTADTTAIKINSQFLKASAIGKYKLSILPVALSNTISKYYNTGKVVPLEKPENPQQIKFVFNVDNDPIISKILPEIKRIEPINIHGSYNSANDSLVVGGTIPRVVYGTNTINGISLNLTTKDTAIVYNVKINALENKNFRLGQTTLNGDIKDNIVSYKLEIDDQAKKQQYLLSGRLKRVDNATEITLNPNGLMLNYENWNVDKNNTIKFSEKGITANQFKLSNDYASLNLQSESDNPDTPLNIELKNFTIQTFTNAILNEQTKFNGIVNGTAKISNLTKTPKFESKIDVTDFAVGNDSIGNIALKVNNKAPNILNADVVINGNNNQVNLNGDYNTANSALKLKLNLKQFNMNSLQALSFGAIKDSKGYISGNFDINGSLSNPDIVGDMKFNDVSFRVSQFNALYKGINNNISFTSEGITLKNFEIEDEKNNLLTINGNIATTDYKNFGFNIGVTAKNFRAVNSKAKDNDFYYGDLYMDADLKIKGTLDNPVLSGSINVNEDTNFTVVLPQQDPRIADREGIVEFVDEDNQESLQRLKIEQTINQSSLEGMDVSLNIGIDKEATMNIIVDKGNGDYLELKGEAQLTGGIDPSGKTTLTGRYEFNEGAYQMSFNFIKRKFDIQKGSYILWTGEPTTANINITAAYKTETSPIDLVLNQISGKTQSEINTYKQKIPINTLLKINGELLKPELSFDIQIPDGNYNVSSDIIETTNTKLEEIRQQPSELNKQVLALLILNRFIGENPFASEAGGTSAEALARQSVSKILSQQLNNLASDLIKGVELNFDLESTDDYTTGEQATRTDLNVGISKSLFNDRLKVSVGSSFGLEGPQQPNQQTTNIAGDVSVNYKLTQDGRYLVRAFRKNEYQVALQGQVVETGVSFVITMSYDKFKELFQRTPEEKEMLKREKQRREREKEEKNKAKLQKETENNLPPNSTSDEDN